MQPFTRHKDELCVQDGSLLWGNRVVIPQSGRATVLAELHIGHPGICRMKGLARSIVWWPGLKEDIENTVKDCHHMSSHSQVTSTCSITSLGVASSSLHSCTY